MDKWVIVTGASKGIGKAIAIDLGRSGYNIVVHYNRDEAGAEDTINQIEVHGHQAKKISFNVRNREDCKEKLETLISEIGAPYGVVLNAGITKDTAFPAMTDEDWDDVLRTNLDGFYNVIKPCTMPMVRKRKPGRIVVMSSVSGVAGNRGQVNYSASKAGLIGATKALAIELAKRNITVNCVAPGLIDTGMVSDEIYDHAKKLIPMQRMGSAEEIASLVNYLMSDGAAYLTRQVISVNGGMF